VKHLLFVRRTIYGALLVSLSLLICTATWAKPLEPLRCGAGGAETLTPTGHRTNSPKQDLLALGICYVDSPTGSARPLLYVFHNVNIVRGGQLIFCDRFDIDFWAAESILVENMGELRAVSTQCAAVATTVSRYESEGFAGSNALPETPDISLVGAGVGPRYYVPEPTDRRQQLAMRYSRRRLDCQPSLGHEDEHADAAAAGQ
jgi:hypothetical protein